MTDGTACAVDGCECAAASRGWCWGHYKRWLATGEAGTQPLKRRKPKPAVCTVDGCERDTASLGWCWAHYYRWRRTGDVGTAEVKTKHPDAPCLVNGCHHYADSLGYCLKHYTRVRRHGSPDTVLPATNFGECNGSWKGDDVGYTQVHRRLRTMRGPASSHVCVSCGGWAADWSYNHTGTDERISVDGPSRGYAYTTNPDDYSPRCRSCHRIFDLQHG